MLNVEKSDLVKLVTSIAVCLVDTSKKEDGRISDE